MGNWRKSRDSGGRGYLTPSCRAAFLYTQKYKITQNSTKKQPAKVREGNYFAYWYPKKPA